MNWKVILKGVGNAAINGAVGGAAPILYQWATASASGIPAPISGKAVGFSALAMGILGVLNYFVPAPTVPKPEVK